MLEIFRSAHFVISLDDEHKILRRQRTGLGYTSSAEIDAAYEAMLEAVESLHRPEYALLADVRLAPPRNDAPFEGVIRRYYDRLYRGFHKGAALVKTEAGRLQVARLMTPEVASRVRVFTNEQAALDFLRSASAVPASAGRRPR